LTDTFVQPDRYRDSPTFLRWWPQLAVLLLVVVELCWVLPWFFMVTQITTTASLWTTALILGIIMLASYAAGYGLEALRLMRNVQLAVLGILLVVSLIAAENLLLGRPVQGAASGLARLDPGAVLVLFFVIWMWWRGVSLSRGAIQPLIAWRRFELGLLFFMAYIFIASRVGFIVPGLGVFLLFLYSGLLAVIFARVSYVGIVKGVRKNPFDLRWSFSVGGILAATVALAAVAGGLLSGQYRLLLDFLSETIKLLIAVVIFILGIPGLLISYALGPLMPWLKSLLAARVSEPDPRYPVEFGSQLQALQQQAPPLPQILQFLFFWGLVLLLVVLLIMRVRKTMGRRRDIEPPEPESLLERGEAGDLLRKALQNAWQGVVARLRPAQRMLVAARIRRIYTQLLELCADLDQPRLPQQTPNEFLPELGELFPARTAEIQTITQAYVRVRYGELPEDDREMDAIEDAWTEIQAEGRRLKRAGVGKLKTADVKEVERSGT